MPRKVPRKNKVTLSLSEYHQQWRYHDSAKIEVPEENPVLEQLEDEDLALELQEQEDYEYAKSLNNALPKNLRTFVPREVEEEESEDMLENKSRKSRKPHLAYLY
jgi:hypothetical protein